MNYKKQFILVVTLCWSLVFSSGAYANDIAHITVIGTSDIHGHILGWDYFKGQPAELGLSRISTLVKQARSLNPNTILIDDGDFLQGSSLDAYCATVDKKWTVHPMIAAFNTMRYDAIVVGNHEFNFGLDFFKRATKQNNNILSANTLDSRTGVAWSAVKPYVIKEMTIDGDVVRVGIIGVTTPAIPNFENLQNYQGLVFEDQVKAVKRSIAELKQKKIDLIIVASHSGVESKNRPGTENQIAAIASQCSGVNLIIAGHDHVMIDNQNSIKSGTEVLYPQGIINGVPVMAPKNAGQSVTKAEINMVKVNGVWEVQNIVTENMKTAGVEEDPEIVQVADFYHNATLQFLNQKIGEATGDFSGSTSNSEDTALIDLVNDAQRHFGKAQLSAAASFNSKAYINKGDIKRQNIASLYVYENYLYTILINGEQLIKFLEKAADNYGKQPDYNYDMIQGAEYTIDLGKPSGSRITRLLYQGKAVLPTDTFTLAMNNYRFNGGGRYMEAMGFTGDNKPKVLFDSQKELGDAGQLRELITRYVQLKSKISPISDNNWNVIDSGKE